MYNFQVYQKELKFLNVETCFYKDASQLEGNERVPSEGIHGITFKIRALG